MWLISWHSSSVNLIHVLNETVKSFTEKWTIWSLRCSSVCNLPCINLVCVKTKRALNKTRIRCALKLALLFFWVALIRESLQVDNGNNSSTFQKGTVSSLCWAICSNDLIKRSCHELHTETISNKLLEIDFLLRNRLLCGFVYSMLCYGTLKLSFLFSKAPKAY